MATKKDTGNNVRQTTRVIQEVVSETYEYINLTNLTERPEIMFFELSKGKDAVVRKVLPGQSIWFTQQDLDKYMAFGDKRFLDRRIIAKNKDGGIVDNIIANDDLSEMEIEILVKETEKSTSFRGKISKINAVPTLKLFLKFVEKYDKPMSFYKMCKNRIDIIETERDSKMSFKPPVQDKRLVELDRQR